MVGIPELSGTLSGLKAAMDIAKGLNATAGAVSLNEAKIGLQSAILDAQSSLLAAQEAHASNLRRIDDLEQEIMHLKDWEAEKQRYQLQNYLPGTFAYALKAEMAAGEPPHRLCARCYQQGVKSILQATGLSSGSYAQHQCHSCNSLVKMSGKPRNADQSWSATPEA